MDGTGIQGGDLRIPCFLVALLAPERILTMLFSAEMREKSMDKTSIEKKELLSFLDYGMTKLTERLHRRS